MTYIGVPSIRDRHEAMREVDVEINLRLTKPTERASLGEIDPRKVALTAMETDNYQRAY